MASPPSDDARATAIAAWLAAHHVDARIEIDGALALVTLVDDARGALADAALRTALLGAVRAAGLTHVALELPTPP